ncbi:TIGR04283 family arsenosugar biosynthesis glycosyltransferase [Desulfuromonas sp. KJ2020]|uniref:TIGR04283 family arsenosugar biosynthesis glycosyltransferase n=1 Tax=Desulfuromonas sp. KJ2020 TaxID=2919173 RepID=UPI0020A717E5|nr:TIGR04283 family arsenosugar biosynthesis glycosyltransferase [Desulfuromonas sp. KJ2020]MCP3178070.1 TIGR04283 family arsenosugar biosynthesis glycosyltransferase [Desulfuromonas sp. KJ2020]
MEHFPTADPVPQLSVIVPVYNEAATIPTLFSSFECQAGIQFEVILVDGGSADDTFAVGRKFAAAVPFACRVLRSQKGRASQLNAGARHATAPVLLFLHADSCFSHPLALAVGLKSLSAAWEHCGHRRLAGRFSLRFLRQKNKPHQGYFYYEAKARLNRPQCIHGDQGFMMAADFFAELGRFDENLPLLEDTHLADRVLAVGQWLLFSADILTSARRFETEGLVARQCLNALTVNFAMVGFDAFFDKAADIYRTHDQSRSLKLGPFFSLVHQLMRQQSIRRQLGIWYRTGKYVRSQGWQLAFWVDVRRAFKRGVSLQEIRTPFLQRFDRVWDPLTDHPLGNALATLLTAIGFYLVFAWLTMTKSRFSSGRSR